MWEDFTTYFNLYYNTVDLFEQAETAIKEQRKDLFATTDPGLPGSSSQNINKVIEKCSKILQFNATSSFVDDALMMLGKSFYYQKNFVKALRKFQELKATQPESGLVQESELWEAKCELQLKNYSRGLELLKTVRSQALASDNEDILIESYLEEIRYHLIKEDYEKAIVVCDELFKNNTNNDINALVKFELGELYTKLEDYEKAAQSYNEVELYSSSFELEFNARIRYGKMLLYLDRNREALAVFNELKNEQKYAEYYDQIDIATGMAYRSLGDYQKALEIFYTIDTAYASSPQLGNSRYELAELYEYDLKQFDSANVYYQKALSSSATADYLPLIREKSQLFNKYFGLIYLVTDYKKQLFYSLNPDEYTKDSIAFYTKDSTTNDNETGDEQIKEKSENIPRNRTRGEIDNIEEGQPQITIQTPQEKKTVKIPPKKPVFGIDSLTSMLAKNHFALGNLFFTDMDNLDSAYFHYTTVLREYPGTIYEGQVLFTLGNYYLTRGDTTTADSLFTVVYEKHKGDKIVNAAAEKLNKPKINFDFDPAKDTYEMAEKLMLNNKFLESYSGFYGIYLNHPKSSYAPKALLACGYILEDKLLLPDSAASIYDTLVAKYPRSQYATSIATKLAYYKQEKSRIKQSIEDSLRIEKEKLEKEKQQEILPEEEKPEEEKKEEGLSPELYSVIEKKYKLYLFT